MQRALSVHTLCLGSVLVASVALAQSTTTAATQPTASTPSATIPQSSTSISAQGAFDKLSPSGQKIARVLCDAQTGGCPSSAQTTSSSTLPVALTRDQIAELKQHMGWWRIFRQMQTDGQIPSRVRHLGQLVGGLFPAQSSTSNPGNGHGK